MASSTPAQATASDISAPFGVISQTNQSGLIAIITALSICFVLVSSLVHIYVRVSGGPWKIDDNVLAAAAVLACVQSALVFFEVHKGLGKDPSLISPEKEIEIKKIYYANNILYILVLCLSKASVGFLYLRLTRVPEHVKVIYAILGASIVWGVMSIPLICIDCSWRVGCSNSFDRWLSIGILDCFTDTALVLMSVYLVSRLQVSMKRKMTVVGAFATRLLLIPAVIARLYYLNPSSLSSNRNLANSIVVVCTQLQLGYSIMTSSVSSFKPFVTVYEKTPNTTNNYYPRHASYGNNTHRSKTKDSFKLDSLSSATNHGHRHNASNPSAKHTASAITTTAASLVPDNHGRYLATVSVNGKSSHSDDDEKSIGSHGSRQMIIERETAWSVHDEMENGSDEIFETTKNYSHVGQAL